MPHPQLQTEIERLYETESLTDELMDDEANALLQWGEAQVRWLADQDNDFEAACQELRRLMGRINTFVGLRDSHSPEEQQLWLGRISESALLLGYALPPDFSASFAQASADWSAAQCLQELLARLALAAVPPPQTPPLPWGGFPLSALFTRSHHDEESVQKDGGHDAEGDIEAQ
jgi:hypothetical protein